MKTININLYEGRVGLVYVRVSSKKQESEGTGLQTQEGRCIKELESMGVPYIKTFPDSFTGGGDFMRRPAMRELLQYIDKNPHKKFVIIFDDLKRFARDTVFHFELKTALRVRDAIPKCLNYNFDDSPEGVFTETIFAAQGQLEREQNRRQVIQKQKALLELGRWPFASRKPYKMEKDTIHGHGKILTLQYPQASWLKEAMEGFATATFARKIDACKFLVEKGFWTKQSPERYIDRFTELLEDVLFAGYIEYPKWEVERREGCHEALISLETFNLIQRRMKTEGLSKRIRKNISDEFPQRGLILCAYCNKAMTAAWSAGRRKKYPYYFCQNKFCELKQKSIPRKDIEVGFDKLLRKQVLKEEVGMVVERVFELSWKDELSKIETTKIVKQGEKKELESEISRLIKLTGSVASDTVRNVYEQEIEKLANKLKKFDGDSNKSLDLTIPYRTALDKAVGLLKNPYDAWQKLPLREQHGLFYFIFETKIPYDINEGYRIAELPTAVRLFEDFAVANPLDVEMAGIEPACTRCFFMSLRDVDDFLF